MVTQTSNFFDAWLDNQKKMVDTFVDASKQFSNPWVAGQNTTTPNPSTTPTMPNNPMAMYNEWMKTTQNWLNNTNWQNQWQNQTMAPFNQVPNWLNSIGTMQTNFNNMFQVPQNQTNILEWFKGADRYTRLMKEFSPVYQQLLNGFKWDDIKSKMSPDAYNKMIENMFAVFKTEETIKGLEQMNSMVKNYSNTIMAEAYEKYMNFQKINMDLLPGVMQMDWSQIYALQQNFNSFLHELYAPALKLVTDSKEKAKLEVLQTLTPTYNTYITKTLELQHLIYKTANEAWENMMKKAESKLETGEVYTTFDEFYKEWSATNEALFIETFKTEVYSALQSELVSLYLDLKKMSSELMEQTFSQYPVVVRTEMDELYKVIHDLKAEVKALKKELKTPASTTDTPEPTTTTSKRK